MLFTLYVVAFYLVSFIIYTVCGLFAICTIGDLRNFQGWNVMASLLVLVAWPVLLPAFIVADMVMQVRDMLKGAA